MLKRQLWRKVPVAAAAIAIIFVVLPVPSDAASSPAPSQRVTVTNDSGHPVPTKAQGTTSVVGTVSATQGGAWKVNVGTLPPVSGSVSVSNASSNPLSVIGAAPSQLLWAFKDFACDEVNDPNNASFAVLTVPAGKIAVIETVSAELTSDKPDQIPYLQIYAYNGTTTYGGAWIGLQNEGTSTDSSVPISVAVLVGTQDVRLYVPAGATIYGDAQIPAGTGSGFGGDVQLTGYYLNAP